MTQDEIIRMAREAGIEADDDNGYLEWWNFAKLVAAHEREKLKNVAIFSKWYEELDKAVLAEREACAKVCDVIGADMSLPYVANNCAAAIRARGEQ